MKLDVRQLARMMDLSAVRTDVHIDEVRELAEVCRRYGCICTSSCPATCRN